MGYEQFETRIIAIARRKAEGDKFLVEELRSEMHIALPMLIDKAKPGGIEAILGEIAEAYLRGYKGRIAT